MKNILFSIIFFIGLVGIFSCASVQVTRTSVDTVTDLSGRWNDTDSRLVSESMIADMLTAPWLPNHEETSQTQKKPVIITGSIRNKSSEHIEVSTFIKDIERSLVNSRKATVVASSDERLQIRAEREDQQTQASSATIKRLGEETGADYVLIGNISSQSDNIDRTTAITYQIDLELISVENTEKIWIGLKKIKKIIKQRAFRF